jgi:hypothetical protein
MKQNVAEIDFQRIKSGRINNARTPSEAPGNEYLAGSDLAATAENIRLLERAYAHWRSLADFRKRRARARDYFRGYQWRDLIVDPLTNKMISEEDYIKAQGKVPLKQNLIRQMVKNLLGQYRSNPTKTVILSRVAEKSNETEMMTNALQSVKQTNNTDEVDVRALEEFFISGASLDKVLYSPDYLRDTEDVKIKKISLHRMFCNADIENFGHDDIRLIGEIHDLTMDEIVGAFAPNKADELRIRSLYRSIYQDPMFTTQAGLSSKNADQLDFYLPRDINKGRVFEIWEKKSEWRMRVHDYADATFEIRKDLTVKDIQRMNDERVERGMELGLPFDLIPLIVAEEYYDNFFYVKFLTPNGHCLYEAETPYLHKEHPYVLNLFPLIDGEVWGLVEDVIDQQRYVNRLITLMDFVISASAKGVLLVPKDVIPEDSDIDEFAKEWRSFNGVIAYTPKAHAQIPQQVSANSVNFGATELLQMQMSLFQDISGVQDAIQGKSAVSGTPASMYAQQAQNSTINSMDYVMAFNNWKQRRDWKVIQVIQQFYQEERYLAVSGKAAKPESRKYDPKRVENMKFDTVIAQGTDSPIYRQVIDDSLMKFLQLGAIDIKMLLQNSALPFAGQLLDSVTQREEELKNNQLGAGIPPELLAQLSGAADPKAVALGQQAAGAKQPVAVAA